MLSLDVSDSFNFSIYRSILPSMEPQIIPPSVNKRKSPRQASALIELRHGHVISGMAWAWRFPGGNWESAAGVLLRNCGN